MITPVIDKVLILDKDDTLTDSDGKMFSGVRDFMVRQQEGGLRSVIATASPRTLKGELRSVADLYGEYFARDKVMGSLLYWKSDGTLGNFSYEYVVEGTGILSDDDLCRLIDGKQINWERLKHKSTGEPFNPSSRYFNPHHPGRRNFVKDIDVIRQKLQRKLTATDTLQMVLVGDNADLLNADGSDPGTPHISVDGNGGWLQRPHTDLLLKNLLRGSEAPAEVFDEMASTGDAVDLPLKNSVLAGLPHVAKFLKRVRQRRVVVEGTPFILLRGNNGSTLHLRAIIENTHAALMQV